MYTSIVKNKKKIFLKYYVSGLHFLTDSNEMILHVVRNNMIITRRVEYIHIVIHNIIHFVTPYIYIITLCSDFLALQ